MVIKTQLFINTYTKSQTHIHEHMQLNKPHGERAHLSTSKNIEIILVGSGGMAFGEQRETKKALLEG